MTSQLWNRYLYLNYLKNNSKFLFLLYHIATILFLELSLSYFSNYSFGLFNWHYTHLLFLISILFLTYFYATFLDPFNHCTNRYINVLITSSITLGIFLLFIFSYKLPWKSFISSASNDLVFTFVKCSGILFPALFLKKVTLNVSVASGIEASVKE